MLMSNAGRVIQHEGRELGQSIIFLGGFLKTPIISRDVPPSRQPCGRIRPTGAFPQLLLALPGGTWQTLGQLLGVQEHPSSAMSSGSTVGRDRQTSAEWRRWRPFPFNACQVSWSCKYTEPDGFCCNVSSLQDCTINYRCIS